jgi:DNA-binding transcriptional ArsR family regulator
MRPASDLTTITRPEVAAVRELFYMLSDPTRLRILLTLCGREQIVSDLVTRLRLPQATVSHHLGLLRQGQLVTTRRDGRNIYYRLADAVDAGDGCTLRLRNPSGLTVEVEVPPRAH